MDKQEQATAAVYYYLAFKPHKASLRGSGILVNVLLCLSDGLGELCSFFADFDEVHPEYD
jgi:hypothetical protein